MRTNSDYSQLRKVINTYLGDYPIPSSKENKENLNKLKSLEKNSTEYTKLRHYIILSNGGFGMRYVLRYSNLINDDSCISELFQESIIGIAETIDAFDISLNTSFTTYAYFHIKKRIIDYIKKNKIVRAPRELARNIKPVSNAIDTLLGRLHKEPNLLEIIKYLKKEKHIILKPAMIESIRLLIELNSATADESFIVEYKDHVSVENNVGLTKQMEMILDKEISQTFNEIEAKVIKCRFGIGTNYPHSLTEINYMHNLSRKDYSSI